MMLFYNRPTEGVIAPVDTRGTKKDAEKPNEPSSTLGRLKFFLDW